MKPKKYMHYTDNVEGYIVCGGGKRFLTNTTRIKEETTCPQCLGFIRNSIPRDTKHFRDKLKKYSKFIDIDLVKEYIKENKTTNSFGVSILENLQEFKKFLNDNAAFKREKKSNEKN